MIDASEQNNLWGAVNMLVSREKNLMSDATEGPWGTKISKTDKGHIYIFISLKEDQLRNLDDKR